MGLRLNDGGGNHVELSAPTLSSDVNLTLPATNGEVVAKDANGRIGIDGISGTGAVELPKGTTAERPGTSVAGMIRYNTGSNQYEYYNGNSWFNVKDGPVVNIDYLVVAGGGSSGVVSPYAAGVNGSESKFHTFSATGGGGGGSHPYAGLDGGSGGGGGNNTSAYFPGGAGITGQGNDGGNGDNPYSGGGGGGAGAAGTNANSTTGGNGGNGATTSIISTTVATANSVGEVSGSNVYFAGGGGGTYHTPYGGGNGTGGLGGGGDGGTSTSDGREDAAANTGGGGGAKDTNSVGAGGGGAGGLLSGTLNASLGTAYSVIVGAGGINPGSGGDGGSGVVILRMSESFSATFTSGVTSVTGTEGGNRYYIIKSTTDTSQTVTIS